MVLVEDSPSEPHGAAATRSASTSARRIRPSLSATPQEALDEQQQQQQQQWLSALAPPARAVESAQSAALTPSSQRPRGPHTEWSTQEEADFLLRLDKLESWPA